MANFNLDEYVMVHERLQKFRDEFPEGRILTSIIETDPVVVKAEIYRKDDDLKPWGSGHACVTGTAMRKGAPYEKTETAAIGRALAACGYEIKKGIASREEMEGMMESEAQSEIREKMLSERHAKDWLVSVGITTKADFERFQKKCADKLWSFAQVCQIAKDEGVTVVDELWDFVEGIGVNNVSE